MVCTGSVRDGVHWIPISCFCGISDTHVPGVGIPRGGGLGDTSDFSSQSRPFRYALKLGGELSGVNRFSVNRQRFGFNEGFRGEKPAESLKKKLSIGKSWNECSVYARYVLGGSVCVLRAK